MTKKNEFQSIIIIALPLMAAFLAERGMQFIDSVMMGWLGSTALAAGALGTALFFTTIIFPYSAISGQEIEQELVLELQSQCGLLLNQTS